MAAGSVRLPAVTSLLAVTLDVSRQVTNSAVHAMKRHDMGMNHTMARRADGRGYGWENFWLLPMAGHTYACTLARACLTWLRSWWTHSCSRSRTLRKPTVGCWPPRSRSA